MNFFVVCFIILPAFKILQSAVCFGKTLIFCLSLKAMIGSNQQVNLQLILIYMYTLEYIQIIYEHKNMES